jgi:hypothetical protein
LLSIGCTFINSDHSVVVLIFFFVHVCYHLQWPL